MCIKVAGSFDARLAALCEMDGEGLRDQLMCVMHKTRQLVHQKEGTPLDGVAWTSTAWLIHAYKLLTIGCL